MATRWSEVALGARMADMQEVEYRNTLAIASLIELLIEQGLVDPEQIRRKSLELDQASIAGATPLFRAAAK